MNKLRIDGLIAVMEAMIKYELEMAEFYNRCAEAFKVDEKLWQGLALIENVHADNIKQLIRLVREKTEHFEAGRPFNIAALNTAVAWIKENTRRVAQREIRREGVLILARDFEKSIIEARYGEIVKTNDLEYQSLMQKIVSDTQEHHNIIQKAIDSIE